MTRDDNGIFTIFQYLLFINSIILVDAGEVFVKVWRFLKN
jgi:hypothetical protein